VGGVDRWFRPGQERWIAMQLYFPATSWPGTDNPDYWQTIFAATPVSNGGNGGNVQLYAYSNRLTFAGTNNTWGSTNSTFKDGDGPAGEGGYAFAKDTWIKLTYHILFSADPAVGFIEIFGDLGDGKGMRALATRKYRATLKYDPNGVMDPAHVRLGIYRDSASTATQVLHADGFTVASTRAGAEAAAYATQ
jgi:hypothetical protein